MNDGKVGFKIRFLAFAIGVCVKLIGGTVRLLVRNGDVIRRVREKDGGFILAGWHGRTFLPIYAFRGYPVRAVVSLSRDGEYAARVFQRLGWSPIRGSTNQGSVRVLLAATRSLRKGQILALTPDGPRGPAKKVAAGVIYLAAISGCPIIPIGVGMTRAKTLRSWDDFAIPHPFSTGFIVYGEPFYVPKGIEGEEVERKQKELEKQLNRLENEAQRLATSFESNRNFLLYNALLLVCSPAVALYFLYKVGCSGRTRRGLKMQLGGYPRVKDGALPQSGPSDNGNTKVARGTENVTGRGTERASPRLWIHAVSVGEVMAANPIAHALRERFPEAVIYLSTTTDSGQETAKKLVTDVDSILYFPFDFPWAVRRALEAVGPDLFMMVETEFWPTFLHIATRRNIPVVLVNGRISDRALKNYRRLYPLWRWMSSNVTFFAMRSETDAARLRKLGVPSSQMCVTGDVKLDQPDRQIGGEIVTLMREALGLRRDERLLLAGSTHPGEEEILLKAWWQARIRSGGLRLLLAPRHLERVPEVERMVREQGFQAIRKSRIALDGDNNRSAPPVILLDTLGELFRLYAAADVTFVGGSLIPRGGHNVLEPAFQGKPVLYGPHVNNFQDAAQLLRTQGIGFQVTNAEEITEKVDFLLRSHEELSEIRQCAMQVLESSRGAARRVAHRVELLLDSRVEQPRGAGVCPTTAHTSRTTVAPENSTESELARQLPVAKGMLPVPSAYDAAANPASVVK